MGNNCSFGSGGWQCAATGSVWELSVVCRPSSRRPSRPTIQTTSGATNQHAQQTPHGYPQRQISLPGAERVRTTLRIWSVATRAASARVKTNSHHKPRRPQGQKHNLEPKARPQMRDCKKNPATQLFNTEKMCSLPERER